MHHLIAIGAKQGRDKLFGEWMCISAALTSYHLLRGQREAERKHATVIWRKIC